MKRVLTFFMIICIVAVFFPVKTSAENTSFSWYCKRVGNNGQPPLPAEFGFIEKYPCIWLDKSGSKKVYLTFDAGYENGNIEKILDILKEENVKATFFILENLILSNRDLVERMINEGHLIGNHTCRHLNMSKVADIELFRRELRKLEDLFYETYGVHMSKYYRPPEGCFNMDNLDWAEQLGYKTVMWSFAYEDWINSKQMTKEKALGKMLSTLHNGEVMLLHPTSSTNAEILKSFIQELKKQGFEFGTVDEIAN